ncbi:Hypothetical predicted protein, partial [Cloeon dipterum]
HTLSFRKKMRTTGLFDELHVRLHEPGAVEPAVCADHLRLRVPHSHVPGHLLLLADRRPCGRSRKGAQGTGEKDERRVAAPANEGQHLGRDPHRPRRHRHLSPLRHLVDTLRHRRAHRRLWKSGAAEAGGVDGAGAVLQAGGVRGPVRLRHQPPAVPRRAQLEVAVAAHQRAAGPDAALRKRVPWQPGRRLAL